MQQPARSNASGSSRPGCSAVSPPDERAAAPRDSRRRPSRRARPRWPGRAGRRRRSRGRRAAPPRCRRRRRRTSRRGRCRSCRSGRSAAAIARLRADPVGRADEQRLAVAGRDRHGPAEAAEPADTSGPAGRLDGGPHQGSRPARPRDVDAGPGIGGPGTRFLGHGPASLSPDDRQDEPGRRLGGSSSSMNLRLAASYGTGSGIAAVEAGEAELLVRQVERGEDARGSTGSRANRPR